MKKEKNSHKKEILILLILFFVCVFLRSFGLSQNLFFGPEQGIDFQAIRDIAVNHNPVLIGAKTDIAGIFHGPIYYYLGTIPFIISYGDPVFIAYFFILINSLSVFLIYYLGKELFSRHVGYLSAILFTVSFDAIVYTHWLSSHPLVIPLSAIFLLSAAKFVKGHKNYLFLLGISYALLGQAEFLNYLFFGGILTGTVIVFFKEFKKLSSKFIALNVLTVFFFGFLHYLVFEIRNQFIMTKSVLNLLHGGGFYVTYWTVVIQTYYEFTQALARTIFPFSPFVALCILALGLAALIRSDHKIAKRLLLLRVFVPIGILIVLRHDILQQFFVYSVISSILVAAFLADFLLKKKKAVGAIFFAFLVSGQLMTWYYSALPNKNMFFNSNQPNVHFRDEKAVIDEIYKRQKGKDFSFQSYTIPYWSQQGWEYLFWQCGKQHYGYEPINLNGKTLYVIIQDDPSNQPFQQNWLKYTVSKWGTYKDSFRKGAFTVRVLTVP